VKTRTTKETEKRDLQARRERSKHPKTTTNQRHNCRREALAKAAPWRMPENKRPSAGWPNRPPVRKCPEQE